MIAARIVVSAFTSHPARRLCSVAHEWTRYCDLWMRAQTVRRWATRPRPPGGQVHWLGVTLAVGNLLIMLDVLSAGTL